MYDPARDIFTASEEAEVDEHDAREYPEDLAQNGPKKTVAAEEPRPADSQTSSNVPLKVWLTGLGVLTDQI